MDIIYEGKAKILYPTDNPSEFLMEFKDEATAFNGKKKAVFENKGRINKRISLILYEYLEQAGIPTHFVRDVDDTKIIVKRVEIIPIEFVVRNVAAGSLSKRTGITEGTPLSEPILETYYKSDALGDPMLAPDHIRALQLATEDELAHVRGLSLKINRLLTEFFHAAGFRLLDFKLEFGKVYPDEREIILADEISPDTCRIWELGTDEILDKDRFRRDLGRVMESYQKILERISEYAAHR